MPETGAHTRLPSQVEKERAEKADAAKADAAKKEQAKNESAKSETAEDEPYPGERPQNDNGVDPTGPTLPTVDDARGIERITGPAPGLWQPAPTEATETQAKMAEKRLGLEEEKKKTRQDLFANGGDEEAAATGGVDRAKNVPADGGSQSVSG